MPETKQELKRRLGLANNEIIRLLKQIDSPAPAQQSDPKITHEVEKAAKSKGSLAENFGKFVLWLFGIGIGCLSNYISGSPSVLYFSCSTFALTTIWFFWRRQPWRSMAILVSIGLFFCTYKYVFYISNKPQPESSLNVYPYDSPVPQQPFETDFVLKNEGGFELHDVSCNFVAKKIIFASGQTMEDNSGSGINVGDLHPGQQTTLHTANAHFIIFAGAPPAFIEMVITINFRDASDPTKKLSRSFDFITRQQESGVLKWYPGGNFTQSPTK